MIALEDDPVETEQRSLYPGELNFVNLQKLDYQWILDEHETTAMVLRDDYFDYTDIKNMYDQAGTELDPLFLVKWKNLSYADLTWEPLSSIKVYDK